MARLSGEAAVGIRLSSLVGCHDYEPDAKQQRPAAKDSNCWVNGDLTGGNTQLVQRNCRGRNWYGVINDPMLAMRFWIV